jgi:hypothetical protein
MDEGWLYVWMDWWMDGWVDGWMDGWMDGDLMDGWIKKNYKCNSSAGSYM